MAPLATAAGLVFSLLAAAPPVPVDAFSAAPISTGGRHAMHTTSACRTPITALQMSDEEPAADETTATAEDAAAGETEEPKLDPEVVALKDEIASLESDLKAKKANLNNLKEMADKYSSTGYARQVALVENNKRLRRGNVADSKSAANAEVLRSFLPFLDELDKVGAKYEGNAFASTLDSGLRSELANSMGELGVAEYAVEAGQTMDAGRVVAVQEEYSEEYAKGRVIAPLRMGLEISGNVVRPAEVVGSLGSESAEDGEGGEEGGEEAAE
ncbi:hypothetical protein ACHAXT_008159 [Thalassiosira profunda]